MRSMTSVPIGSIKRNPRNARTHSKKQIRQLAKSIREFGWANPLTIDVAQTAGVCPRIVRKWG